MKSFYWPDLNEEQRYAVWSLHMEAGGKDMTFFDFCDLMDKVANN